ncbi:MAG: hypothetical protein DRN83_00920 [Hadesarchaea archaeon]|nr:MAG: hypothetical protein DRN83_00920 [Hadesarchaea archaeon]
MTIREAFGVVLLVVLLQLSLGVLLYGPFAPAPGLDIFTVVVAVGIMAAVAGSIATVLVLVFKRYASERAVRIALMTLTEDERRVFEAIVRSGGEVRQDKLRREVDMSKSKLSALVNNLERKHAITKTRYWKTNILKVTEEFGGR